MALAPPPLLIAGWEPRVAGRRQSPAEDDHAPGRAARADFLAERICWGAIAAVIIAALAGWLGGEPAPKRRIARDGLVVEYEPRVRADAPSRLVILASPGPSPTVVRLGREYLRGVGVTGAIPAPAWSRDAGDAVEFAFEHAGGAPVITMDLRVRIAGRLRGSVAVGDGAPVEFSQFAWP